MKHRHSSHDADSGERLLRSTIVSFLYMLPASENLHRRCEPKAFSWICPRPRLIYAVERTKCATKRTSTPVALHDNLDKNG